MLRKVEEAEVWIDLSSGGRHGGLLFAGDFVGVSESKDQLQLLIICACLLSEMEAKG